MMLLFKSLYISSQLPRLATGRVAVTNGYSHRMFADRSLRPFPWPQRTSFTPKALYIIRSCHEQDNKRYSCPVPRVPMATIRPRSNAKIQQLLCISRRPTHTLKMPFGRDCRGDLKAGWLPRPVSTLAKRRQGSQCQRPLPPLRLNHDLQVY